MTHRNILWQAIGILAVSISLLAANTARADQKNPGEVSAVGTTTLALRPKVLRIQVDLLGKGKDLKTAMANLRDRRDAVKIQLGTLKADMKSLTIGPPATAGAGGPQEQQIRAMIMQRARQKGGAAPELPTVVTLRAPLTVEWALTGDDDDARLIAATELCGKITAADLAGAKDKQVLSPEQQEVQEEMAQMSSRYSGEPQQGPGDVQFLYVAEVSDAQASQALADAFAKAKQQGDRLAKAVGGELGSLRKAEASVMPGMEGMGGNENYYAMRAYRMAMARQSEPASAKDNEVITQDPNHAVYRTAVQCVFEVK
ncbi:MAG: SIMPL domain-containing protein [Planctomycetia bacterium]|nr:SIMPL domain-containing protein [Planctomycetia bacterium]